MNCCNTPYKGATTIGAHRWKLHFSVSFCVCVCVCSSMRLGHDFAAYACACWQYHQWRAQMPLKLQLQTSLGFLLVSHTHSRLLARRRSWRDDLGVPLPLGTETVSGHLTLLVVFLYKYKDIVHCNAHNKSLNWGLPEKDSLPFYICFVTENFLLQTMPFIMDVVWFAIGADKKILF